MPTLDTMIAPSFYGLHNMIKAKKYSNFWLKGGRGSTKSSFVSIEIILGIMKDEQANALVLRKVASTLRDSVFDQYIWAIDKLGVSNWWHASYSPLELTYIKTGQKIRFKGADNPRKIKSQKFRTGYIKFKHFEECDEFKGEDEIRSINQSLNRGGSDICTFYSYNPPASPTNWVNKASERAKLRDDTVVSLSTYLTVPKAWLGREFLMDAEQLKKDNLTSYKHEYLGEVTGTGAEVFNNVTLRKISDEELKRFDNIKRGLDFGFARDPLAYVTMHYDKTRRVLYYFDELVKVGLSNAEAVSKIQAKNKDNDYITCDSAEPRTIAEFRSLGLKLLKAKKGKDSRNQGYKWLQGLRAIIIDPVRCPTTAREYTGYHYEKDNQGNFKAIYPDGDDHTLDASRYGLEKNMKKGGYVPWT
ncbi:PBSX family phage terminase large subunit [Apilactobacillus ozensis]|nr:PBSX family phage terminase large subunit [Apilactobacillus ozensis]